MDYIQVKTVEQEIKLVTIFQRIDEFPWENYLDVLEVLILVCSSALPCGPYPHVVVTLLFWGVDTFGRIHWIQSQHTLAEHLAFLRVVEHTDSCLLVCTMGALLDGAFYHGACLYNQEDFLGLDAIVCP